MEIQTTNKTKKMGTTAAFFAIMKGYCAINVLLLPLSFSKGGYILSSCAMLIALFFESMSAAKLTTIADKYKIYSYPLIMERAMGRCGLIIGRLFISVQHCFFTFG